MAVEVVMLGGGGSGVVLQLLPYGRAVRVMETGGDVGWWGRRAVWTVTTQRQCV